MTHVHPTAEDPLLAGLSEVVGGPVGEHVAPRRTQGRGGRRQWGPTVLGVLLAITALTFVLGLVAKTACAHNGWSTTSQTRFTHGCVSDVPEAYVGTGLVELAWPWSGDEGTRLRYPVTEEPAAVGLWTYAAARVTHLLSGSPDLEQRYATSTGDLAASDKVDDERRLFVAINALGFVLLAGLATAALAGAHRRRPWDAAAFAAAPALALAGIVSWDLLPVAAVAGALWAWSRGRPVLTGALIGIGTAAGVWPVLLLVALALVATRDARADLRPRALAGVLPVAVTAVAVWALVNAPAYLTGRAQWERFWRAAWERGADEGSIWTLVARTVGLDHTTGLQVSWALLGLWFVAVAALVVLAPGRPRLSQVALLLVAGVLLLGLNYEPEQVLWLLPLAALAHPRWRDLLVWQACEAMFFMMTWWWDGGLLKSGAGTTTGWYWAVVALHVVGTLWLVAVVVRDIWWPEDDVVVQTAQDVARDELAEERRSVLV